MKTITEIKAKMKNFITNISVLWRNKGKNVTITRMIDSIKILAFYNLLQSQATGKDTIMSEAMNIFIKISIYVIEYINDFDLTEDQIIKLIELIEQIFY